VLAAAAAFAGLVAVAFYVVPAVGVRELEADEFASEGQIEESRASIRGDALQAVGAIAIAVGLVLTARSVTVATRSLTANREAQLGERVGQAIDHLESDEIAVRVGGIYSLERIAEQAPWERQIIFQVLTTVVRKQTATDSHRESSSAGGWDADAARAVLNRWPWHMESHSDASETRPS
jgi:hypothetical protein